MTDRDMQRPLGPQVIGFAPPPAPGEAVIEAPWIRLERLSSARHAAALFQSFDGRDDLWDYMGNGPYASEAELAVWLASVEASADPCFYAIVDPASGRAEGFASFLRIDRSSGVIEIGFVVLGPALQGRRRGSAALMAMTRWAFEAGYRRLEWKCNALNAPSRRAALRLGFAFEGVFRQHMIVKGRNRDTAWFAITDGDWPALRAAHEAWLSEANFDAAGIQRQSLADLTRAALPGRQDG